MNLNVATRSLPRCGTLLHSMNKRIHFFRKSHALDPQLAVYVVFLLVFGLIMLFSASVAVGLERFGDSMFFVKRQLFSLGIGFALLYICYRIPYKKWQQWSFILLLASAALLFAVFIPGIGITGQGAKRWIDLGIVTFQPSELVKLTLILYLSAWLAERGPRAASGFRTGTMPFLTVMGLFAVLIMSQPDMGTLMLIFAIGLILFFAGGASLSHLAALCVAGLGFIFVMVKMAPYRLARLTAFFDPDADPLGIGYHINQALIAIGSGGFFGRGLGHSRQKFLYLPEVTGDSIFAIIAEETGFLVSAGIIILFVLLFMRAYQLSQRLSDSFGSYVLLGIGAWITLQAFVNIGAMLSVLPLTGLPLPFISYGGSSLIITLGAIGILFNIAQHAKIR